MRQNVKGPWFTFKACFLEKTYLFLRSHSISQIFFDVASDVKNIGRVRQKIRPPSKTPALIMQRVVF